MAEPLPALRIFISSPGDVAEERAVALAVIKRLQGHFQGRLRLVPILWEQEPLLATAGFQEEIERRVPPSGADVALFILWSRLGTPLSKDFVLPDGRRPTGTEWEFDEATEASSTRQLPHILVYRKSTPPSVEVTDPRFDQRRAEFAAVEGFFQRHFRDAESLTFTGSFHTFRDASAFGQALDTHLTKLLAERVEGAGSPKATWQGSPFRGLEAFEAEHSPVFFGRTRAIQEVRQALARQVRAQRAFVLILGPSGNGKSSLARAGLLPLLTGPWVVEEGVAGGFCRQAILRPADAPTPLEALADALTRPGVLPDLATRGGPRALAEALAEGPKAAVQLVRGALEREAGRVQKTQGLAAPPPARLVLLVDQLEELFTKEGVSARDREAFARVVEALATSGDVWVLATLRSDFYPAFTRLAPFMALKEGQGQYDLPAPDAAEVAQAIRGPAQAAGLVYEVRSEDGRSLDEVLVEAGTRGADALPLLEFLLTQLWERRAEGHRLTFAAYEALGGLEGAIAQHAEDTWTSLEAESREAFPGVVRALVEVGEGADASATRRRAPQAEVAATASAKGLLAALVKARLVVAEAAGQGAVVTVAHEALLRAWPRLAERLKSEADLLRIRSRLRSYAARWQSQGREPSLLLASGKPLEEARLLSAARFDLTALESDFVRTSELRARRLTRLKRTAVALIALLAVGAGWLAFDANRLRRTAENLRDRTLADSARVEDLSSLRAVLASRETLYPVDEASVVRAAEQIAAARATLARLPAHERALEELEGRALARPLPGTQGSARGSTQAWRFAEAPDATAQRVLAEIVREARAMAPESQTSALTALERRVQPATTAVADWGPLRGLLTPQFGLFPLGKDPASGLQEFAHLYSGSLPTRGPDGALVYADDAAVVFVLIPGGTYFMGAQQEGPHNVDPQASVEERASPAVYSGDEGPVHEVTLSAFFLAKHECTQAQWARLTGGLNPSRFRPGGEGQGADATTLRNPVEQVSWDDCAGSPGWALRHGLALPTEAQWEYACRAPLDRQGRRDDTYLSWHDSADEKALLEVARIDVNSKSRTWPVGSRQPNRFGLFDMHGNVFEWCRDGYDASFYGTPAATQRDPINPDVAPSLRVYRGGSWGYSAKGARSANRYGSGPVSRLGALGLRLARAVTSP